MKRKEMITGRLSNAPCQCGTVAKVAFDGNQVEHKCSGVMGKLNGPMVLGQESVLLGLFWRCRRMIQYPLPFPLDMGQILRLVLCLNLRRFRQIGQKIQQIKLRMKA